MEVNLAVKSGTNLTVFFSENRTKKRSESIMTLVIIIHISYFNFGIYLAISVIARAVRVYEFYTNGQIDIDPSVHIHKGI